MPTPTFLQYHSNLRSRVRRMLKPYGAWGLRRLHFHRLNNVQSEWQLGPVRISVSKRSRMVTGVHFERDRWCKSGLFSLAFGRSGVHAWWARDYHVSLSCVTPTQWASYRSIGQRVEWAMPHEMPHVTRALAEQDARWYADEPVGYDEPGWPLHC